jgi:hypothetical protein
LSGTRVEWIGGHAVCEGALLTLEEKTALDLLLGLQTLGFTHHLVVLCLVEHIRFHLCLLLKLFFFGKCISKRDFFHLVFLWCDNDRGRLGKWLISSLLK